MIAAAPQQQQQQPPAAGSSKEQQACSHPSAPNAQLGSFPEMLLADLDRRIYPTKIKELDKNWNRLGLASCDPALNILQYKKNQGYKMQCLPW